MIYKFHFWVCNIGLAKKLGVFYNRLWRNSNELIGPPNIFKRIESRISDIYVPMFTAPLFIAAKRWKQPQYPLRDEWKNKMWSVQFSSVTQLCLTLCDLMDYSTPGLPVHHQLLEFIQTHVHWVGDATQPSHPLSSPSPVAFNLSQHQGLCKWVSSSHQVAKVLYTWYIHAMRYHSGLKLKGILTYTRTWIKLEDIMLSDKIKSQKDKYCMIPFIWGT